MYRSRVSSCVYTHLTISDLQARELEWLREGSRRRGNPFPCDFFLIALHLTLSKSSPLRRESNVSLKHLHICRWIACSWHYLSSAHFNCTRAWRTEEPILRRYLRHLLQSRNNYTSLSWGGSHIRKILFAQGTVLILPYYYWHPLPAWVHTLAKRK